MELKKGIYDKFKELFYDLLKLIFWGGFIFLLSLTPIGNWFKCNFLDTQGCLPKFTFSIKKDDSLTFRKIQDNYTKEKGWYPGNTPENTSESMCVKYTISIINLSYKGRGSVSLKWSLLMTANEDQVFLSKYRLVGKPENRFKPVEKSDYKKFNLNVVDLSPGKWFERESAEIELIFGCIYSA